MSTLTFTCLSTRNEFFTTRSGMKININNNWRSIPYADAMALINEEFKEKKHGFIRALCREFSLSYTSVIDLKNNRLDFEAPLLVFKVLEALGYEVKMTRDTVSTGKGKDKFIDYTTYQLRRLGKGQEKENEN